MIHYILDKPEMTVVITDYVLGEVKRNIKAKWPHKMEEWQDLRMLLFDSEHEYADIEDLRQMDLSKAPVIRDSKDQPVVYFGMLTKPDILLTGDKDFQDDHIKEALPIMKPAEFRIKYMGE
jgi:predicted nucleic acid-binding protein